MAASGTSDSRVKPSLSEGMRRAPRIAIVGGGVGGLAAALALERRGAEIVVCEQSPALNEIGAGLNLSPNALLAPRAPRRRGGSHCAGVRVRFSDHPQLEERAGHLAHAPRYVPPAIRRASPVGASRRLARRAASRAQGGRFSSWSPLHRRGSV